MRERLCGVYVITEPSLADPLESTEQVLRGGARLVQLRAKSATTRQLITWGQAMRDRTRQYNALLIVNDRLDVALAIEADGVHLGQDDLPVPLARRIAGNRLLIGVSAETVEEARQAASEGADYLGVGPMFTTVTKPDAGTPVGPARIRQIKQVVGIPVFGIGGIQPENALQVLQAGADGICVISAVLNTPNPEAAVRRLIALWQATKV
ncbi:MAG: thiamine phosphate synthase [Armatimonadota bacterium]